MIKKLENLNAVLINLIKNNADTTAESLSKQNYSLFTD
jgi:hypothetical protein